MSETINFRSDNEGPVVEPIMQALIEANDGMAYAYGEDPWTQQLKPAFSELFECEVEVLPLATGTAGNSAALAQMTPPWGSIVCHELAHIYQDECGAPELFSGGARLVALPGDDGKLQAGTVAEWLSLQGAHGVHNFEPAAISLTQATEAGTLYRPDQVSELAALAHEQGMRVHMDGARFANAVAALGVAPAEITWRAGVDALTFGASKNGAMAAEALVVFSHPEWLPGLERRRKRAGHLLSKMRYVSAQLLAYIDDDLWLQLAGHANTQAGRFAAAVEGDPGAKLHWPAEANEVFPAMAPERLTALADAGFDFHRWPGHEGLARLVFAPTTGEAAVTRLIAALQSTA